MLNFETKIVDVITYQPTQKKEDITASKLNLDQKYDP